jgi:peptidoglycan/xylan/chitin deacetylase (PgdA/CDA1 family)
MNLLKSWKIARAMAQLRATIRSQPFTILLFHSVGRPSHAGFLPKSLDCPADFFETVLEFLSEKSQIVPLSDIARDTAPAHSVALTFDDGFRDNFTVAFPLLQKYRAPATIFVATDAIGATELLPIHKFYRAKQHKKFAPPSDLSVDSPKRRQFVDDFCARQDLKMPPLGEKLYANWSQLRQMADRGMEIGAHTCSHPWLAALPPDEQRREILGSKQILEEKLGRPVKSFAYPYGYRDSFNAETAAIVGENFESACLSVPENMEVFDPKGLPRYSIATFYTA